MDLHFSGGELNTNGRPIGIGLPLQSTRNERPEESTSAMGCSTSTDGEVKRLAKDGFTSVAWEAYDLVELKNEQYAHVAFAQTSKFITSGYI